MVKPPAESPGQAQAGLDFLGGKAPEPLTIEIQQRDWMEGFSGYVAGSVRQGPALVLLNLAGIMATVAARYVRTSEAPYFIVECIVHELTPILGEWAGVEFNPERVGALVEMYRHKSMAEFVGPPLPAELSPLAPAMRLASEYRELAKTVMWEATKAFGQEKEGTAKLHAIHNKLDEQLETLDAWQGEGLPGWLCQGCGEWRDDAQERYYSADDDFLCCEACASAAEEEFGQTEDEDDEV